MPLDLAFTALACLVIGAALGAAIVARRARARAADLETRLGGVMREQSIIVEHAAYAIVATRPDGIITAFNPAAERLFGHTRDEVVGKVSPGIFHDPAEIVARAREIGEELGITITPGFEVFTAKADRDLPNEYPWTYIRKDGTRVAGQLSVTAIRDESNAITGYMGVALDISEQRRAAEALQRATEAAEAANRAKSEFLATMSHEIRTPMNGVLGFANLLSDTPLTPVQADYVATINSSGKALLAIINDILDFSKIEAGKLVVEQVPVDLARAVRESALLMSGQARRAGLFLKLDLPPEPVTVIGDQGRIRQLLLNLIGNALKFTERGGVTVRVRRDDGGAWRAEVQDTGIGIPEDKQAQLFQHFTQADASTTRRFGGTGLGLAITRRLVTAMGGNIGLHSVPGEGSTFWVTLPSTTLPPADVEAAPPAGERVTANVLSTERDAPIRVLLCEDNSVNQRLATLFLERAGFRVDLAGNGREGIAMWEQLSYDVILMDCHMPEMDGFDATRFIRAREDASARVPIIALTASAMESDRESCLSIGMDDFVTKPIDSDLLGDAVRRWAGRRSAWPGPLAG